MKNAPIIKIPLLTYFRMLIHDPITLRTQIFKEYGDIAYKKSAGLMNFSIDHPDFAQHILQNNQDNYLYKHPLTREIFGPIVGMNSLFINNDLEQWYRDRLTLNPAFDPKVYFDDYSKVIVNLTQDMFNHWENDRKTGGFIDVTKEIDPLIITIFSQTLFTQVEVQSELYISKILNMIDLIKKRVAIMHLVPFIWPLTSTRIRYNKELHEIKSIVRALLNVRMQQNHVWDDLLGRLLKEYRDVDRQTMIEIVSYQITMFFAVSYFTSSASMQWLLMMLSLHPDAQRKIESEVDSVLGDRPPTFADVPKLKYLATVLKEVSRLHPAFYAIYRQAIADDVMGGYDIPKNAGIVLSVYHVHRHPDFWVNPDGFDPDRFSKNAFGQDHPFAFIPFGGGKRRCIGAGFSIFEITLIIAMLAQRYRLFLPANTNVKNLYTTITTVRPDVKLLRLERRR